MSKNFYKGYSIADNISRYVEWAVILSALILLVNVHCEAVHHLLWWNVIIRINTFLLVFISLAILYANYLNFRSRGNKLAGMIDDAYGTTLALEPPRQGYYDNENVRDSDLRFALNAYESCYFSYNVLDKQTKEVLLKNIAILLMLILAFALNQNDLIVTIRQLYIVVYYLLSLIVFFIVKRELCEISRLFHSSLNCFKNNGKVDQFTIWLYVVQYETAMVWMGTVLSSRYYKKYNKQLTEEWKSLQKMYIDTIK